jgi:hypothetical protein
MSAGSIPRKKEAAASETSAINHLSKQISSSHTLVHHQLAICSNGATFHFNARPAKGQRLFDRLPGRYLPKKGVLEAQTF